MGDYKAVFKVDKAGDKKEKSSNNTIQLKSKTQTKLEQSEDYNSLEDKNNQSSDNELINICINKSKLDTINTNFEEDCPEVFKRKDSGFKYGHFSTVEKENLKSAEVQNLELLKHRLKKSETIKSKIEKTKLE